MKSLLEIHELKTYFFTKDGIAKAVNDVSWDVASGETVALVGESGCGKSITALSVMQLVDRPGKICGGKILFDGMDLLELDDFRMQKVRGKQIGMIFQEPMTSLNPVLTIERQLTEPFEIHLGMDSKSSKKKAVELLEMVGISDANRRIKNYPSQFSGGMRQRVMIAMAISCNPKLLIADEPTTAVDVTTQAQLFEIMCEMTSKFGTALVVITHNLGVVARYAQRVVVMYAGRIVEKGTAADIYSRPQHPYTMGLMASVPRLDEAASRRLTAIDGMPPSLTKQQPNCAFSPRCTYAVERCQQDGTAELRRVGEGHWTACWQDIGKEQGKV